MQACCSCCSISKPVVHVAVHPSLLFMLQYIQACCSCCSISKPVVHVAVFPSRLFMLQYIQACCSCCSISKPVVHVAVFPRTCWRCNRTSGTAPSLIHCLTSSLPASTSSCTAACGESRPLRRNRWHYILNIIIKLHLQLQDCTTLFTKINAEQQYMKKGLFWVIHAKRLVYKSLTT